MKSINEALASDVEKIKNITVVPTILEVICRITGMGFAAIARVTEDRWVACSVRDEINFGLKEYGELPIVTTICNEIRQSGQAVLIDHVDKDPVFSAHPTPKMYGFQSYISIPIILPTGEFFGTLCAIDPSPRVVTDIKAFGTLTLFAQLIAFHLQALDLLDRSSEELTKQQQETKRYEHLTYHTLKEPLRKIAFYSDVLIEQSVANGDQQIRFTAEKINQFTNEFSKVISPLV